MSGCKKFEKNMMESCKYINYIMFSSCCHWSLEASVLWIQKKELTAASFVSILFYHKKSEKKRNAEGSVWVSSVIPAGLPGFSFVLLLRSQSLFKMGRWLIMKMSMILSVPLPSSSGVSPGYCLAPLWRQMEDAGVSRLFGRLKHLVCDSLSPTVLCKAPGCRLNCCVFVFTLILKPLRYIVACQERCEAIMSAWLPS